GFCPKTRLSAMLEAEGCAKRTDSSEPISKLCQLMAARSVPWVTRVLVPARLTLACPATTCSPVGPAQTFADTASRAKATARATGRMEVYRPGVRITAAAARGASPSSLPTSLHDAFGPNAPVTYDFPSIMSRKDLKTMNPGRAIIQQGPRIFFTTVTPL